jgi:hypothetical protein
MSSSATRRTLVLVALAFVSAPACRRDRASTGAAGAAGAIASSSATVGASVSVSAVDSASAAAAASANAELARIEKALAEIDDGGAIWPLPSVVRTEVTIVAPKVPGAAEALAKGKWRLNDCVPPALLGPHPPFGVFELALLFDADGRVATVTPKDLGAANASFRDCLGVALAKISFPQPSEEGARGVVTVSLRAPPLEQAPSKDAGRARADGG